jgi:hypothetical protein
VRPPQLENIDTLLACLDDPNAEPRFLKHALEQNPVLQLILCDQNAVLGLARLQYNQQRVFIRHSNEIICRFNG